MKGIVTCAECLKQRREEWMLIKKKQRNTADHNHVHI